jgi:hypothetical protein
MSGDGNNFPKSRLIAYRHQEIIRRQMTAIGLPDFETAAQCIRRNQQIQRRLQNHAATPPELVSRIQFDPCPLTIVTPLPTTAIGSQAAVTGRC